VVFLAWVSLGERKWGYSKEREGDSGVVVLVWCGLDLHIANWTF